MNRLFKSTLFLFTVLFLLNTLSAKDYSLVVNGKSYEISLTENTTAVNFIKDNKDKNISASKYGGFEYYTYSNLDADKSVEETSNYQAGKIYFNIDYKAVSFTYKNQNIAPAKSILIGEIKDKSILTVFEKGDSKLNLMITDKSSSSEKKSIVVYYSLTETTSQLAKTIANEAGADLFRLELKNPYSTNGNKCNDEKNADEAKGIFRPLQAVPDLSKYDVIYIGTPVWSNTISRPVLGWLKSNDFNGKTVAAFVTTWSTGAEQTISEINELTKGANHFDGIYQYHGNKADVKSWLKKNGVK